MEQEDKTKELETGDVSRLLWKYAIPSIISMIIASIYNIIDRIFIGQGVGPLAIAGLAITFPIMNVIHAMGSLIGVGSTARMSIVLGQKDQHWAEQILGNSLLYTLMLSGVACLAGYVFLDDILYVFGATSETLDYARRYMLIILPGMYFTTISLNQTGLIRSSGYPTRSMLILVLGAVVNIVLDALFIFVFDWGIEGAAWATTIAMALSAILSLLHFCDSKSFIRFRSHGWKLSFKIFRNIILIGMSPFLMNLAGAGVVAIENTQLIRYGGDLAVGAFGIVNSVLNLLCLFIVGLCQGMQPISGYNYGAGHHDRLKRVFLLTVRIGVITGIIGFVAGMAFPRQIAMAFTNDAELLELSTYALRVLTVMFPVVAYTIVNSIFFQSIDKPYIAIITSMSRQVIFLIPALYLIPQLFVNVGYTGLQGVFWTTPLSDLLGGILAFVLLMSQRKVFRPKFS